MDTPTQVDSPLDLDHVDFGTGSAGPLPCGSCRQVIHDRYWTLEPAGTPLCASCQPKVEEYLAAPPSFASLAGGLLWGAGAALIGSIGWWGFTYLTGYEVGLIAIAVGYGVGWAVRRGSQSPGGRAYQAMALVLTYLSIAGATIPYIVQSLLEQAGDSGPINTIVALVFSVPFALALPFLSLPDNVIGLLLIGFALWQAWQLTARVPVTVRGPLQVGGYAPR